MTLSPHYPDTAQLCIDWPLHPYPALDLQVEVVDDLLGDLFARRDHRDTRRIRRDHFGADPAGARLERDDVGLGQERLARRKTDRRHLREMVGPRLHPSLEDTRRREDVERT